MNEYPKISVIIPSYNSGKFLNEAIESVVNQTYKNLEIIIVNDGSIDDTEKIAKEWQEKDKRVRYLKYQSNRGLPAARNTGIKNSQGDYLAFLDADDIWLPSKLETQLEKIKETKSDLIFSNWYIWSAKSNHKSLAITKKIFLGSLNQSRLLCLFIRRNLGNPSTALLKKEKLFEVGFFDEELFSSEDYDLWLRFILKGGKISFINQPLIYYRKHSEQMTTNDYKMRLSRLMVFKKVLHRKLIVLARCPILIKKIILLEGYKWVNK